MPKHMVKSYWFDSSDSESSGKEGENDVIIGLAPEAGEKYRNCVDIVMKSRKMKGTIRMALNPTLEDILADFFMTLEDWKQKESDYETCDGNQLRKKKYIHSKMR